MQNILEESLLDIKQVKEVAEKNAKNLVLENLMPKIKTYIEDQLIEGDLTANEAKPKADGKRGVLQGDVGEEDISEISDEPAFEDAELEEDENQPFDKKAKDVGVYEGENSPFDKKAKDVGVYESTKNNKKSNTTEKVVNIDINETGGNLAMSDLYKLLESELEERGDPGAEDELEETYDEGVPDVEERRGHTEPEPESEPEVEEGGDMSDLELEALLAEMEDELAEESLDEWVEIDEAELAAALREMNDPIGLGEAVSKQGLGAWGGGSRVSSVKLEGEVLALKESNIQYKRKIHELHRIVDKLSRQLEESNIFNAKLLYANKLLNKKALTKEQKLEIIETLDEAKSLREVKLVYNTFTKSFNNTQKRRVNESAVRAALPGGSSRPTTTSASTQRLNESSDLSRWQKLAGIQHS